MSAYSIVAYPARELPDEYEGLVFSKWLRSLRYGNDYFRLINVEDYYRTYHHYIALTLSKLETVVRLAVLEDDRDVVLGFSVSRGNILDFVHVHKHQRQLGIGRNLVPKGIDTITHLTKTGLSIWGGKYGSWKFNPFA